MPEARNRAGNAAGVLRPVIAGPSGSGASPRLSGWPARPGSCGPFPAPPPCCPGRDCPSPRSLAQPQTASSALKSGLYPGRFTNRRSSPGVRRYSRTASPRWAGALSQMTCSGPGCFSLSCSRKATEVPELLLPSSSIHSTSPVSRHTAE